MLNSFSRVIARTRRVWIPSLVVTALAAIGSVGVHYRPALKRVSSRMTVSAPSVPEGEARPVYPYSVVSGGIGSTRDLASAMRRDPVVAMHYASFQPEFGRTEALTSDELVYVSFRKGNDVYWTRNRVLLRAGEKIVTDGKVQARGRCGNQISKEKRTPTIPDEPKEVYLNVPLPVAPEPRKPETPPTGEQPKKPLSPEAPPMLAKNVPPAVPPGGGTPLAKPTVPEPPPAQTGKFQPPFVPSRPPEVLIPPAPTPPLGPPEIGLTIPLPPNEPPDFNPTLTKLIFTPPTTPTELPVPPSTPPFGQPPVPPPYVPGGNKPPIIPVVLPPVVLPPVTTPPVVIPPVVEIPPPGVVPNPTPEPAAWVLMLAGLCALYFPVMKQRSRAKRLLGAPVHNRDSK